MTQKSGTIQKTSCIFLTGGVYTPYARCMSTPLGRDFIVTPLGLHRTLCQVGQQQSVVARCVDRRSSCHAARLHPATTARHVLSRDHIHQSLSVTHSLAQRREGITKKSIRTRRCMADLRRTLCIKRPAVRIQQQPDIPLPMSSLLIHKFIHHEGSTLGYIRYMLKYKTDNYKEDRQ